MQQSPAEPGPLASLVLAIVNAYNNRDVPFFEKILARDVLWLDEDGHFIGAKEQAVYFIDEQLTATPQRRMSVTAIRSGITGIANDTGWAAFSYVIESGDRKRTGVTSILFKKPPTEDWQAVLVHGATNAPNG